jgi:glycine/D-amino acid oxidase-like deaminating enzyme
MAGAGAARDLALRGLSVALVEKSDFASATTARSSKLIHGGLRYLELFDFGLVRESLRERQLLGRLAPHLVRPLPFLVPIYGNSSRGVIKVRIGLTLYDWLTPGPNRERYRVLRAVDALSLEPGIQPEDLRGAGYYFDDLLLYPERLCPGERAVGVPPRRARVQLRAGGRGPARRRRASPPAFACAICSPAAWPPSARRSSSTPPGRGWTSCGPWRA